MKSGLSNGCSKVRPDKIFVWDGKRDCFSRHNGRFHCGEKKQSHLKVDKTNRPQQKQVFG